jgi:hypothetical protein
MDPKKPAQVALTWAVRRGAASLTISQHHGELRDFGPA